MLTLALPCGRVSVAGVSGKFRAVATTDAGGVRYSEDDHAKAFVAEFRRLYPKMPALLIHIANEGAQAKSLGAAITRARKLNAQGQIKGTPDYFLAYPFADVHGLWLELKAPGGTVKHEQIAFLAEMRERGYAAVCVWGWAAAIYVVGRYLRGNVDSRDVYGAPEAGDVVPLSMLTLTGTVPKRRRNPAPTSGS